MNVVAMIPAIIKEAGWVLLLLDGDLSLLELIDLLSDDLHLLHLARH